MERLELRGVVVTSARRRPREWAATEVIDLMIAAEDRFLRRS